MYQAFMNLTEEKRQAIINAALKEFSINNYATASTNRIVSNASISKGILFHYFGSKKNLYLFLYDYTTTIFSEALNRQIDLAESDIFKRYEQIMKIKVDLMKQYHALFDFLKKAYDETSSEVRDELNHYNAAFQKNAYATAFEGIDTSLFRENLDIKKAIDTIQWVTDGISHRYEERLKAHADNQELFNELIEQCMEEASEYFLFLKTLLYQ
ncbi:TetR/AcrR family transcriptional regulator [Lysinibacillus capsici]|uniref:TetR/AcrR family transcriptional regulator n=1 Tax=Lysinibacillus capsici TaxID=2115968 RepID=UPI002A8318A2|nr:TetR/AcrR family transcriptional regulator [Lysinibacillus capsici]